MRIARYSEEAARVEDAERSDESRGREFQCSRDDHDLAARGLCRSDDEDRAGSIRIEDLITRCGNLLSELEAFRDFLKENNADANPEVRSTGRETVDIRQFHAPVITEMKSLQKLSQADQNAEKTIHTLKSSNLPYYIAIWEAAKSSKGLVTFHKRFYWDKQPTRDSNPAATAMPEKRSALADVVACDGEEWIKVSTVTEKRLLFELAKAQWEEADSSSEEDETNGLPEGESTTRQGIMERMDLVRTVEDLVRASRAHRIHYQNPTVRIVLSKISNPPPAGLLELFDRVRTAGAVIDLSPQSIPPYTLDQLQSRIFPKLMPSQHPPLTSTLNIDCTILLALVSDLSHTANHPILPTYNDAIRRQIELETREHLLPTSLWPAMSGKALVCTEEAAQRMREIVDTIGTPLEKSRTELILERGASNDTEASGDSIRGSLAKCSDYDIPDTFLIPINIVPAVSDAETQAAIQDGKIPSIGKQIAEELTDINRSVFMYGWVRGITTVSSNRSVAKWIESTIERDGTGIGPEIWLREPARSLVGKEKERRK